MMTRPTYCRNTGLKVAERPCLRCGKHIEIAHRAQAQGGDT